MIYIQKDKCTISQCPDCKGIVFEGETFPSTKRCEEIIICLDTYPCTCAGKNGEPFPDKTEPVNLYERKKS